MCLPIYGRVVAFVEDQPLLARVDVEGSVREVNLAIVAEDGVEPGDWVMVHMGVATEVLDAEEVAQARASLEMLGRGGQTPGWSWSG